MQDGKLNNSQRQALVKLVQNAYGRKIETQRSAFSENVARISREVKEELGVADIEEQIECHESLVKELEAQKEKLGFCKYRNDGVMPGSEAKKLIDERTASGKQKITELQHEMDKTVSAIWTATMLEEVKDMVDEVVGGSG